MKGVSSPFRASTECRPFRPPSCESSECPAPADVFAIRTVYSRRASLARGRWYLTASKRAAERQHHHRSDILMNRCNFDFILFWLLRFASLPRTLRAICRVPQRECPNLGVLIMCLLMLLEQIMFPLLLSLSESSRIWFLPGIRCLSICL